MKTIDRFFKHFLILSLALSILACSKEDSTGGEDPEGTEEELPPPTSFAEAIARGDDFDSFPESRTLDLKSEAPPENEDYDDEDENGDLHNPMAGMFKKGLNTLAYRDQLNLFDQIIVSQSLIKKNFSSYRFYKAGIFNKRYLISQNGPMKGYPIRSYQYATYLGGYSDHFPVYVYLIRELN